ncbi:hypothetical protein [Phycicoccus jejuensis]|uniref:hypothetical protein n=1 Tax=Phycicoccus jejuensis TaxID=367299 RepID=UPI0004C3C443|nr:hypothetical protein [Phycicoccus jejuensis]
MTTLSYPINKKNITTAMWSKLLRRQHQGVDVSTILTLSSTSNVATVSAPSRLNFMGFELEVTEAHDLTLPAVTAGNPAKTYSIGVMYDPALEGRYPEGPLSLEVYTKGSIPIPAGGAWWPIWEVTRRESQTLDLAAQKSYRVARVSTLYADTGVSNPDPAYAQGVQVVFRRDGVWLLEGGEWKLIKADTGDRTDGVTTPTDWSAQGTAWSVLNGMVEVDIRGTLKSGSGQLATASGGITDFRMCTLPALARPRRTIPVEGSITTGGTSGATFALHGVIKQNGDFEITATAPNVRIGPGCTLYVHAVYRSN